MKAYQLEQKLFGRLGLGRLPLAQKAKRFLFERIQPKTAECYGLTLYLDAVYGFDPRTYKPQVAALLKREVHEGDVVVDVGANIGLFTCLMARAAGRKGQVYAFEPEPRNLEFLKKNLAVNHIENVIIVPKALADKAGSFPLVSRGAHSTFGFDFFNSKRDFITVETIRLDDFFKGKKEKIALIKMDIIGADLKALRGMRAVVRRDKPKFVLGFCPAYLEKSGHKPREYLEELHALGYPIYELAGGKTQEVSPLEFDAFVTRYSPKVGIAQGELFCVPWR